MSMRHGLSILMLALAAGCFAQGQDWNYKATSYTIVDDDGNTIEVVWKVAQIADSPELSAAVYGVTAGWIRLSNHEHRDKNAVARLRGTYQTHARTYTEVTSAGGSRRVQDWYSNLYSLNAVAFDQMTDVKKYNDANDAYGRDLDAYDATTVTAANEATVNAWYSRLSAEYNRLSAWSKRIDARRERMRSTAVGINTTALGFNTDFYGKIDALELDAVALGRNIGTELAIADKRAEVEALRDKIRRNNDGLRTLMGVSGSVQEIEDWANLDKERREKGMWEAARSLLDVALAQTSKKYGAKEKITRAELRRFKLDIMYKYKLPPKDVKKILKNWVDDGSSVLTIKTKREFFEQLGVMVSIGEGLDNADKGKYLEAAAGALGFFNKSPVLGLVVTNAQIYTGLFETALTYYESKQRVAQLMSLSESNLKAVASLTELNKRVVETLIARKSELKDLEQSRTY